MRVIPCLVPILLMSAGAGKVLEMHVQFEGGTSRDDLDNSLKALVPNKTSRKMDLVIYIISSLSKIMGK